MSSSKRLGFGGFDVSAGEAWDDITASVEGGDSPFTIARSERGVGAIQFSPAIYRCGPIPVVTLQELRSMLAEFAERRGLGEPFDSVPFSDSVFGIGSSFRSDDDFVRAWYLSDGRNVMLVTYVSDWADRFDESQNAKRSLEACDSLAVHRTPRGIDRVVEGIRGIRGRGIKGSGSDFNC